MLDQQQLIGGEKRRNKKEGSMCDTRMNEAHTSPYTSSLLGNGY
jgi:hypothetical protein